MSEGLFQMMSLKRNVSSCKAQGLTKMTRRLTGPSVHVRRGGLRGDAVVTSGSNDDQVKDASTLLEDNLLEVPVQEENI